MSNPTAQRCIKENPLIDVSDLPIYPITFYSKPGDCDMKFILYHMQNIPATKQREVSDEFVKIFTSAKTTRDGRFKSKTYLQNLSKEYRLARGQR